MKVTLNSTSGFSITFSHRPFMSVTFSKSQRNLAGSNKRYEYWYLHIFIIGEQYEAVESPYLIRQSQSL